jgi:hypothetical protein
MSEEYKQFGNLTASEKLAILFDEGEVDWKDSLLERPQT